MNFQQIKKNQFIKKVSSTNHLNEIFRKTQNDINYHFDDELKIKDLEKFTINW